MARPFVVLLVFCSALARAQAAEPEKAANSVVYIIAGGISGLDPLDNLGALDAGRPRNPRV